MKSQGATAPVGRRDEMSTTGLEETHLMESIKSSRR